MTREKLLAKAFDTVMGAAGMPHETDPDYELWLFNAFITALEAAGVRLVPSKATHKMAHVGEEARWQSAVRDADNVREIWAAMLAASPYAAEGNRND